MPFFLSFRTEESELILQDEFIETIAKEENFKNG